MYHFPVRQQLHLVGYIYRFEVRSQVSFSEDIGRRSGLIVQSFRVVTHRYVRMSVSRKCSRCRTHSKPAKFRQLGQESLVQVRPVSVGCNTILKFVS